MAHTPGPWTRDEDLTKEGMRGIIGDPSKQIPVFDATNHCVCWVEISAEGSDGVTTREQEVGNLSLIEAAPDLLAAATAALSAMQWALDQEQPPSGTTRPCVMVCQDLQHSLRAAIAKATT